VVAGFSKVPVLRYSDMVAPGQDHGTLLLM
jgi:hypothetical protein